MGDPHPSSHPLYGSIKATRSLSSPSVVFQFSADHLIFFFTMQSVNSISEMAIPSASTNVLLHFLLHMPNGLHTSLALKELCTRDFHSIFTYLLSLPHSHWHRNVMKAVLEERLRKLQVQEIKQLGRQYIPKLSALTKLDDEWVPVMEPHTDQQSAAWDTHDWFFQLLHSRQMEGQYSLLFTMPLESFIRASIRFSKQSSLNSSINFFFSL